MERNRKSEEFFEEKEQFEQEEFANYDYDENPDLSDEEEEEGGASVGRKLLTVLIILIALVALFFLSVNLTTLWLNSNEEPTTYETDAPPIEEYEELDDENKYFTEIEDEEDEGPVASESPKAPSEVLGENSSSTVKPSAKPSSKPSSSAKPSAEPTKAPTPTPSADPTKAPETPAPTKAPEKTSKPIIIPGNPAA